MVAKMYLYTDRNQLKGIDDEVIRRFWNKDIAVLTFETVDTAPPADETTTMNYTVTRAVDGTTTPVKLRVLSTDADDTATGTAQQYIHLMGLKATDSAVPGVGIPHVEKMAMRGTNTAAVYGSSYWVRTYGARPAQAGSSGDADGTITLKNTATQVLHTITKAGGMSTMNYVYVPAGWAACVFRADYNFSAAVTGTAHAFYSARYVKFEDEYYNTAGAAGTITRDRFSINPYKSNEGTVRLRQIPLRANTSSAVSYISFHGDLVQGTCTGSVKFYVLLVKL